ncbi:hypothetical protein AB1L88_11520 [Tautonia sp. JC769]|uniref:hypothetical protein n=1 Tax=Tautonia sp. JC769 TaxID=3232135 RepID=UPI0034589E92
MFLNKPEPQYVPGTRVRVVQFVRVGHRRWKTEVTGTVEGEGLRPVGGMEMGGKALYCHQPTLRLRRDDGEITNIALDENTRVETLDTPAPASATASGPAPQSV